MQVVARSPEARVFEREGSSWVLWGLFDDGVEEAVRGCFVDVVDRLRASAGEFNLVRVDTEPVPRVQAYRDATSSYELYTTGGGDREAVVADTFRDALARVPVDDRRVPEASIADHYLFRTTVGTNTYVDDVDRVGHGEWLRWDPRSDRTVRTQLRRLSADPEATASQDGTAALDAALTAVYDDVLDRAAEPFVTMLSGGVDSTLLQTYAPATASMSVDVTAPEFRAEVDYAEHASELTGSSHSLVALEEASFLQALEGTIDALGMPPHHLQKVFWDVAFASGDWATYANGQFADGWFGLDAALPAALASHAPALLDSPVANFGTRLLPGAYASKARILTASAAGLRRPISHPFGLANAFGVRGDVDALAGVVPRGVFERRLTDRFRYVSRAVDLPVDGATSTLGAHLEFGHVIDYFTDDAVSLGRQLAHARDVTLLTPFTDRRVGEVALSIPSPRRYLDGYTPKHHVKSLLDRRVPGYDTSKPKLSGGLPTDRWMASGPFATGFERYGLPEHLSDSLRSSLLDRPRMDSWNALCFSMWEDRVLSNPDLPTVPPTVRRES